MDKKAVSIMIGYVLLVTIAIIMGGLVYGWLKGYVAKPLIECPEETSLAIKKVSCLNNGNGLDLNLTLTNNGLFNIGGYFVKVTNSSDQELATIDISEDLREDLGGGKKAGGMISFTGGGFDNNFETGQSITNIFNITSTKQINSIEIIPIRFQEENNRKKLVTCSSSKIREEVIC